MMSFLTRTAFTFLLFPLFSHAQEAEKYADEERERIAAMSFMKHAPHERKKMFQEVALAFYKSASVSDAFSLIHEKSLSEQPKGATLSSSPFPHTDGEAKAEPLVLIKPEYLYAQQLITSPTGEPVLIILQWLPEEEKPKVDYDATFQVGEVSWKEFLEERSELPVKMRALLRESNYYNGIYEEKDWQAFSLHGMELDKEENHYVYVARESEALKLITEIKRKKKHVIMAVSVSPDAKSKNQFQVDEVYQNNWLSDLGNLK